MKWELIVVENEGEVIGSPDGEDVVIPTDKLIDDMKKQLKFLPKNFTWTIGWRSYVWQEKETQTFKDLTQKEFKTLLNGGTLNHPEDGGGSDTESRPADSSEGSVAQ